MYFRSTRFRETCNFKTASIGKRLIIDSLSSSIIRPKRSFCRILLERSGRSISSLRPAFHLFMHSFDLAAIHSSLGRITRFIYTRRTAGKIRKGIPDQAARRRFPASSLSFFLLFPFAVNGDPAFRLAFDDPYNVSIDRHRSYFFASFTPYFPIRDIAVSLSPYPPCDFIDFISSRRGDPFRSFLRRLLHFYQIHPVPTHFFFFFFFFFSYRHLVLGRLFFVSHAGRCEV